MKESVSKNVKKNYDRSEKIVNEFRNKILPLSKKGGVKTESGAQQPDILDTPEILMIKEEQKILFEEVFGYDMPGNM